MARKAIYKHSTVATTPDDGTSEIGTDEWNAAPDAQGMLGFSPQTSTITISSGNLAVTDTITVAAAETGTTDVIDTFDITNTNEYDLLYVFADAGDTITITHTGSPSVSGQIVTISGINETLSETSPKIFIRKGNYWYGYGGGAVNSIDDVQDVTVTSVGDNEVLAYDTSSSKWINQTAAEAGLSTASATETLTNKTIDGDNNTISNLAHGAEVDNPTSGVHGVTGSVVGTTDTQTLTNKTLTSPVISSISNTGTVTLPTSTDTLVGRATTDTLTNKTINSASNTITITESNISDLGSYITASSTDTLTNKTFDANGTGNSISNIENADIASAAAIDFSKLAALTSGNILVGNVSNVATSVAVSGDVAITNAGVTTVSDLTISGETQGDVLYFNGTNWVRLPAGTNGYYLQTGGAGANPAWAEVVAGGKALLAADSTEVTVTGTTATQVKDVDFIKNSNTLDVQTITIAVRIKTDNAGTTGTVRVRHDGGGTDDLTLTTTSTSYEVKTGTIDASGFSSDRHTLEFFMDDGSGDTISMDMTEVWAE